MQIDDKLKIVSNHYDELVKRYHGLGKTIAQLTAYGCVDAKEYWKNGKYLYLLHSMKNGVRRKKYIGNQPYMIKEAQEKIQNYKDRVSLIFTQENLRSDMAEIENTINRLLGICGKTDMSAKFAFEEERNGYKSFSSSCGSGK